MADPIKMKKIYLPSLLCELQWFDTMIVLFFTMLGIYCFTLFLNDKNSAIGNFKLLNKTLGKIASKIFKNYVYAYTQCKIYIPMSDDVFSSG